MSGDGDVTYGRPTCKICGSRLSASGGKLVCPKHGQLDEDMVDRP